MLHTLKENTLDFVHILQKIEYEGYMGSSFALHRNDTYPAKNREKLFTL